MRITHKSLVGFCTAAVLTLGCGRTTAPTTGLALLSVNGGQSQTVVVGTQAQMSVVAKDGSGNMLTNVTIAWSINDSTIASVSSSGMVIARKVGTTVIIARSGNISGQGILTVQAAPLPGAITRE